MIASSTEKSIVLRIVGLSRMISVINYCSGQPLNFNIKKCYRLGITCKKIPFTFQYSLGGQPISRVSSAKYLGITVIDNLCWNEHVNDICSKANSTLELLRPILSGCDNKVKDTAYRVLVRPKLEYHGLLCLESFHQTEHHPNWDGSMPSSKINI